MTRTTTTPLGDALIRGAATVDPSKYPEEVFDLYSIPAYDRGTPDVVVGAEIGSSKQIVHPGDLLLSRIVPHIRRSWVVGPNNGRRLIASGEWMVFRSEKFRPDWLRHLLLSDRFHREFMTTVAGVGGSLLRARPAHVAQIVIPLPPLDEQRQIAAILDHAEVLSEKWRYIQRRTDDLIRALFNSMFGHLPAVHELADVCTRITDGTHQSPHWSSSGVPFLFISNITSGEIDFNTSKFVSTETWSELTRRTPVEVGDVLYSTVGVTYGIPAMVRSTQPFAFQRHIAHLKPRRDLLLPEFLAAMLATPLVKRQADRAARGAAQPTVNLADIKKFHIILPPLEAQQAFAARLESVRSVRSSAATAAQEHAKLFASLQSRAFRGQL